jgi:hypothetical protein
MELRGVALKDGEVNLPILYENSSTSGFEGIGKDSTHVLSTVGSWYTQALTIDEDENTQFVATWVSGSGTGDDWESYLFEVVSVNEVNAGAQNETKIKNVASGETFTFTDADDKDFGELTLTLSAVNGDNGTATVTLSASSGVVYTDRIVTEAGLQILLPVNNLTVGAGQSGTNNQVNMTGDPTSFRIDFIEGDKDNNVASGRIFNITLGQTSSDGPQVSSMMPTGIQIKDGSDDYESYVPGAQGHATRLVHKTGGNQDTIEIEYHADEAYAEVYVAESSATTSSTTGSAGSMIIMDDEVETMSSKNLIVVGGTCVNTVAAKLLGLEAQFPVCGSAWEDATEVGPNEFLIETFDSPYSTGDEIATLVAGYEQAETVDAANAFKSGDADGKPIDFTEGKKYILGAGSTLGAI